MRIANSVRTKRKHRENNMLKVSDLLGKPLLSLADAKSVGYIGNLWFDAKLLHAKTAEIISDDDDDEKRTFVELRNMQCEGDAAVIKSQAVVLPVNLLSAVLPCPINRVGYNQSGKAVGKVREVTLEGRDVVQIVCENATFTSKEVLSLSDNLCIFNDTGKPIKITKPKAAAPRHTMQTSVTATPSPAEQPAPEQAQTPPQVQTPPLPQNVTVTRMPGAPTKDYSFLLGKTVHSPIIRNGRTLIGSGTVVDEQVIELARKYSKLVQLALRAY